MPQDLYHVTATRSEISAPLQHDAFPQGDDVFAVDFSTNTDGICDCGMTGRGMTFEWTVN